MFKDFFKKVIGIGLALCILGASMIVVPGFGAETENGIAPFLITQPCEGDDD